MTELRELQVAFGASAAATDKALALAFLQEMKVQGLSPESTTSELIAAYRGLAAVLEKSAKVERLIQAARKVKLLPPPQN